MLELECMNAKHAVMCVSACVYTWREETEMREQESGECNAADIFQLRNEVRSLGQRQSDTYLYREGKFSIVGFSIWSFHYLHPILYFLHFSFPIPIII